MRAPILVLPLALAVVAAADTPPDLAQAATSDLEARLVAAVNAHRKSSGLDPLEPIDELHAIARRHSQAMARGDVPFGHEDMGARMTASSEHLELVGFAENVSKHTREPSEIPAEALELWLASPVHRKNLDGAYDATGLGVARDAEATWYVTQIFVARQSSP